MHHLVLADGEVKLPARVVALRIGIEPAGKRQAELDESAKGLDGLLRSNHDRSSRVGPEDGATLSSQRTAIGS